MKATIKISFLLVILVLATSCVSVMIESNKAAEVNQLEGKIFILIDTGHLNHHLATSLEKKIAEQFSELGMSPKVVRLSGLELDDSKVKKEISTFDPGYVMSIQVVEGTVRSSSSYIEGSVMTTNTITKIYDVNVTDSSDDRMIWRAKLQAIAGAFWFDSEIMAGKLVDRIVAKMRDDGLITQPEI